MVHADVALIVMIISHKRGIYCNMLACPVKNNSCLVMQVSHISRIYCNMLACSVKINSFRNRLQCPDKIEQNNTCAVKLATKIRSKWQLNLYYKEYRDVKSYDQIDAVSAIILWYKIPLIQNTLHVKLMQFTSTLMPKRRRCVKPTPRYD